MPDTGKKNKKLFAIIAVIFVVMFAAAIAIVLILKNKPIDENYFVSDDSKLVRDLSAEMPEGLFDSKNIRMVYNYSDNQITKLVTYYGYESEAAAKSALATYEDAFKVDENNAEVKVEGKYIAITARPHLYEGTTTESIKNILELKSGENTEYQDDESVNEDATVEIVWD